MGLSEEERRRIEQEIKRAHVHGRLPSDVEEARRKEEVAAGIGHADPQDSPWIKKAAAKLAKKYDGDAENIWSECLTAGEVIERLDEFDGIGRKKAHMAARILYDDEEWDLLRWDQINVAVDTHIRTVWRRAGLSSDLSVKGIMASATRLRPRYPGELDFPAWDIGRNWCHKRRADCRGDRHPDEESCPLDGVCPKIGVRHRSKGRRAEA